jgi:hypothetical protein
VTARYSIMVWERFGDREIALCECDSNPDAIVRALRSKTTKGKHKRPRFTSIRIVDNSPIRQDASGAPLGEAHQCASAQPQAQRKDCPVKRSDYRSESQYLTRADLQGRPFRLKVRAINEQPIGEEQKVKPVLWFEKTEKGMVLSAQINLDTMEIAFGDDMDNWIGKTIEIYDDPNVSFRGKRTGGIRIRIVQPSPVSPPPATSAPRLGLGDDIDDEIPF